MRYRPPGKAPKTDWGRYLVRRRLELGWSATQAFEAVQDGLGLSPKSRSAYLPFEYDREPTEEEAAVFEAAFGGRPGPEDRVDAPAEPDLAAAIVALTTELAAMRQEREAWQRGVVAALRSYAAGQVPEELLDALAPPHLANAQP